MQPPAPIRTARHLEMQYHAGAFGGADRALQDPSQDDVLRENHRAPHDLAFEGAVGVLQDAQSIDGARQADGNVR